MSRIKLHPEIHIMLWMQTFYFGNLSICIIMWNSVIVCINVYHAEFYLNSHTLDWKILGLLKIFFVRSCRCGKKLHFKGSIFHRVIQNFMIQGGDFENRNGTGKNLKRRFNEQTFEQVCANSHLKICMHTKRIPKKLSMQKL